MCAVIKTVSAPSTLQMIFLSIPRIPCTVIAFLPSPCALTPVRWRGRALKKETRRGRLKRFICAEIRTCKWSLLVHHRRQGLRLYYHSRLLLRYKAWLFHCGRHLHHLTFSKITCSDSSMCLRVAINQMFCSWSPWTDPQLRVVVRQLVSNEATQELTLTINNVQSRCGELDFLLVNLHAWVLQFAMKRFMIE